MCFHFSWVDTWKWSCGLRGHANLRRRYQTVSHGAHTFSSHSHQHVRGGGPLYPLSTDRKPAQGGRGAGLGLHSRSGARIQPLPRCPSSEHADGEIEAKRVAAVVPRPCLYKTVPSCRGLLKTRCLLWALSMSTTGCLPLSEGAGPCYMDKDLYCSPFSQPPRKPMVTSSVLECTVGVHIPNK